MPILFLIFATLLVFVVIRLVSESPLSEINTDGTNWDNPLSGGEPMVPLAPMKRQDEEHGAIRPTM